MILFGRSEGNLDAFITIQSLDNWKATREVLTKPEVITNNQLSHCPSSVFPNIPKINHEAQNCQAEETGRTNSGTVLF